jgi:hypothetical protein
MRRISNRYVLYGNTWPEIWRGLPLIEIGSYSGNHNIQAILSLVPGAGTEGEGKGLRWQPLLRNLKRDDLRSRTECQSIIAPADEAAQAERISLRGQRHAASQSKRIQIVCQNLDRARIGRK